MVTIGGPADLPTRISRLVADLERRWSRFTGASEVSTLNRSAGRVTVVSEETYLLVSSAATAHELTGGRFHPLMLEQLEALGYRHRWEEAIAVPTGAPVGPAVAEPIQLYPEASAVRLPAGSRFDPGGIGKGLAVDLAIEACIAEGATTASVELGGDLRVHGQPWFGPSWRIPVADPFDDESDIGAFTPTEGAVTTSSTLRRAWAGPGPTRLHHLLDPATGHPGRTDLVAVTTCSRRAWWAEVAAKVALLAGSGSMGGVLAELDTPGIGVTSDRRVIRWAPTGPARHRRLAEAAG